ncbi:MAG TPA: MoxR family ATPase [Candidatus Angelobacter sp.]|nr:MoxR family ATPase [Candidatus Angelobacter sp.]
MKASQVSRSLQVLLNARQPVFIWGPPGVGKSDVVREVAEARNVALKDIRALLLDPVDLRGLPFLSSNGQATWATPDFLPTTGEGILFLDELNSATAMVQAACYQLVLDRKLGDYTLPDGWSIVAAGNRDSDRGVTTRMPTPLRNRFTHLNFEVDTQEWCEWAVRSSIRPEIIAFVRFRQELLSAFDRDATAFPSPRSWAFVSKILATAPDADLEHDLIAGTVGDAAATEFSAFLATFRNLPNIDAILMNPGREPVPGNAAAQFAVASALAHCATDGNFDRICMYLDRMPKEFSVMSVRDALLRHPAVQHTPAYTKWAVTNHHVMA